MRSLRTTLHHEAHAYAGDENRPLAGYTGAMALYAAFVLGLAATARATHRQLPAPTRWDVVLHSVATHQLSRLIAKDRVTSPLRMPFTRFRGSTGPAELGEEVRGTGARKTVGELVSCPFCTAMWISTAFTAGSVFAPRATRLATATLTALAGSDFLQFARAAVQHVTQRTS